MYLLIDTLYWNSKAQKIQHKSIDKFDMLFELEHSDYTKKEKSAILQSLKTGQPITTIPALYGYKLILKKRDWANGRTATPRVLSTEQAVSGKMIKDQSCYRDFTANLTKVTFIYDVEDLYFFYDTKNKLKLKKDNTAKWGKMNVQKRAINRQTRKCICCKEMKVIPNTRCNVTPNTCQECLEKCIIVPSYLKNLIG